MTHHAAGLINPEQESLISRVFENYVTEHHFEDILHLTGDGEDDTHHAVVINAMTLFEDNMEVGDYFNVYPNDVLAIFDKVLHQIALRVSKEAFSKKYGQVATRDPRLRCTLHARITGLPVCPELTRDTIPRSRDVGHFLSITGTVIRTSVAKVLEFSRDYMCAKCRHVFTVQADFAQFYTFVSPTVCPNPDGCNSCKFSCLSGDAEPAACRDYQEIKIQEQVQRLSVGSIPRSMVVVLEDDLVDSCKSGDDVTVYGVMCQRWKPFHDGTQCEVDLVLKANNIEVNNQQAAAGLLLEEVQKEFEDFWDSFRHDPLSGRDQILVSLCPQIFGMYVIKLAVAMVMAGGVQRIDSSGTKVRGECHMLLVGDPGTGKSQFLKYAAKVMPRSVLTAGIGSTSAGLTVAAVKDGGEWHLEAGALVLSDGGLCCIDEFNSIKEHDRISIHEAMEQQSISVAKAGMVCKLNTRTTILAATNPKGQYNSEEPLSVNVALASPLLSRFDLVLVLLDTRNAEWDQIISSFILEDRGVPVESSSLWSMEKMKAYFCVIKRLQPQLSEDANSILTGYYQLQRQSNGRNAARTTIRMLESLSRLAEAHAKLMYRETVTIEDAVMAVSVMECSMQGGALLGNVNALLTSFPANPALQYETQCQLLLEGLKLPRLLRKEMDRLAQIKCKTSKDNEPTDNPAPQPRDPHFINKSSSGDLSSSCESEWFTWISHSPSSADTVAPVVTSTQQHVDTNTKRPSTEVSSATKQPRYQHHKESPSSTNNESEMNDDPRVTSTGSAFQRVRDRRLNQDHQQSGKDRTAAGRERMVLVEQAGKKVLDALDKTSGPSRSKTPASGKKCRLNEPPQGSLSCGKDWKHRSGTENRQTVEAEDNLQDKLSDFRFKPRKMTHSISNQDSDTGSNVNDDCERNIADSVMRRTSRQNTESSADGVAGDTGKDTRAKGQKCLGPVENWRQHMTSTHEPGRGSFEDTSCFTSEQLQKNGSAQGRAARKINRVEDGGVPKVDGFSCTSPTNTAPAPSTATSTVASSTLAKLARFSFTVTTENRSTSPEKQSRTSVYSLSGTGNTVEGVHSSSKDNTSRKTQTTCTVTRNTKAPRTRPQHDAVTESEPKAKPPEPSPPVDQQAGDGLHKHQSTGHVRKRKCFELAPPPRTQPFSQASLFGCAELSDDVLDTDWDQEVSKKTKV